MMMVMTAKIDKKKILMAVAAVLAVIAAIVLLLGAGAEPAQSAGAFTAGTNDQRVKFLKDFGWDVTNTPVESSQVRIPDQPNQVYQRYNILQKNQGFDLSGYAGKNVMRYVYKINNYPGATEPVYATLLIYKNQIIGGDVTDTAAHGQIRGFKMPDTMPPAPSEAVTQPAQTPTQPTGTAPAATVPKT